MSISIPLNKLKHIRRILNRFFDWLQSKFIWKIMVQLNFLVLNQEIWLNLPLDFFLISRWIRYFYNVLLLTISILQWHHLNREQSGLNALPYNFVIWSSRALSFCASITISRTSLFPFKLWFSFFKLLF